MAADKLLARSTILRELASVRQQLEGCMDPGEILELYGAKQALEWVLRRNAARPSEGLSRAGEEGDGR